MKIVVIGNYGAQNIGDEMILTGLLKTLREITPSAEITVLSANPEETHKKHHAQSLPKFPAGFRSLIKYVFSKNLNRKALKAADHVVVGGGGLFASVSKKANLIWGLQVRKAHKFKKPVIMYGQSIGKVKGKFLKHFLKRIFQKSVFLAMRDESSKEELKRIGITRKIYLMPDLAFKIIPPVKSGYDSKKIIICLRSLEKFPSGFKDSVINFLNYLVEEFAYQLKFIDYGIGEGDTELHREMMSGIKNQSAISRLTNSNLDLLLKEFSSANLVIGMRLHSIITSILTNTPFMAISYSSKVENLLDTMGLGEHCLATNDVNPATLKSLFEKTINSRESFVQKLEKTNSELKLKHLEMEKQLKKVLV